MLEKLNEKLNLDIKQKYFCFISESRPLVLNKKWYLLFNFLNLNRSFIKLKGNKDEDDYYINHRNMPSLNFYINNNDAKFDYFIKWSSSFSPIMDLLIQVYIDSSEKDNFLINASHSIDVSIFDNIFSKYLINEKNQFYYLLKNRYFSFFYAKELKKNLKFQFNLYTYLYDDYSLLNQNYHNMMYSKNWINGFKKGFFYNKMLYIKKSFLKSIKYNIFLYYSKKIKDKLFFINLIKNNLSFIFLIFKNFKNLYLRSYLNNNKLKNFLLFKEHFSFLYFSLKFNRFFYRYKRYKKYKKFVNIYEFLKERLLPVIGYNIYKMFNKKTFFSFIKKLNNKNYFVRNYYKLKGLIYDKKFKKKRERNIFLKKRKRKLVPYRIIKKMKTFYFIPNTGKTRQQIYSRFKKSVLRKYNRRLEKKKNNHNIGLYLNLSVYNARNRYKNKMKELALKKKDICPYYYYTKKKKQFIVNTDFNIKKYKQLPFWMIKKFKLNNLNINRKAIRKRIHILNSLRFILKKKKIKNKKKLLSKFKTLSIFKNYRFLNIFYNRLDKKIKRIKTKNWKRYIKQSNIVATKKKKKIFFFQRILLYFKHLCQFKKSRNFLNINYIKFSVNYLKKLYKYIFYLIKEIIVLFKFFGLKKKRFKKLNKSLKFLFFSLSNNLYLYLYRRVYYANICKKLSRFKKKYKSNLLIKFGLKKRKKIIKIKKKKKEFFFKFIKSKKNKNKSWNQFKLWYKRKLNLKFQLKQEQKQKWKQNWKFNNNKIQKQELISNFNKK